ncbi:leucine--tRNA ligase [Picrophilus oshimae]|uniref:Leucine--tRNA ligase n=1 Tax=Picrophilus torridus (strain ATCC 700027 / DSM 9790 / JCM 10055 / NBRC 100828 / KAW 2/3) TaxID=1122961 RepID=Q6KZS6_PICTO|nr:leucine--tRNA ligase [Picrophilus oshimae]AAT43776.1 leucyl-tRNA synthetase [Picrophilus oshimae DSM 9789]
MNNDIERKWQEEWKKNHVFESRIDERPKFFVTVPWPYTNGSLHVGHGRTYTLGDIVARYKRLEGYNVLFPMGFHESGTPILAFSERLRENDPETIKLYRSYLEEYENKENIDKLIESFKEPENIANYFADKIIKDFTSLGYSIDWTRRFTSADPDYQEIVKWQFNKLKELKLIKQGNYPILYSVKDENAVGEDDIKDGDVDKVTIEEYTGLILENDDFNLIAASVRPETIFGITNAWISNSKYSIFEYKNKYYAVSKEAYTKLSYQYDIKFIKDIEPGEITSRKFRVPLLNEYINVYIADFVDPDNATGVVYSVPGHAIYDYYYVKRLGINVKIKKVIAIDNISVEKLLEKYGSDEKSLKEATQELYKSEFYNGLLINSGDYSGLSVQEAREKIKNDLIRSGNAIIIYETSRKAITRSGSKVIVAVINGQWFIDYSQPWLKERTHKMIDAMSFYPEFYRKIMGDAIDWLRERPCARRRGIGTRLPFDENWVIESLSDSTIYMVGYTNLKYLRNIYNELKCIPDDVLDFVYLNKDFPENYKKFKNDIEMARNEFNYWYGVDLRITAPPHISNHLSFYLMNHAAIFDEEKYPKGLMISGLVISNGAKISKSKGNVISLLKIKEKYSADIYRLFVAVGADISSLLDWNEKDLSAVIKRYESFIDIMNKFEFKNGDGFIYKWFLSRFYSNLNDYFNLMSSYKIRDAYISIFYNVLNDIKHLELRHGDVNTAVSMIIRDWLIALSPVIPHTCEEYWHRYIEDSFVSLKTINKDIKEKIDNYIIESENYLENIINDIREIQRAARISGKTALITVYGDEQAYFIKNYSNLTGKFKMAIPDYMRNKQRIMNTMINEYSVIKENIDYIEEMTSLKIVVDVSKGIDKKNPWPGRPLIKII